MAITAVLLLSSLGFLAITAQAQNCPRPPKGENMDLKGNDILLTSFPDGTTVTFACNIGYESAGGSPRITCTAGSWSPLGLKCQRKNCFSVENVQDGQIEYRPGTEFGDKAVLICNIGYMPVGGGELTCGSQGWTGRLPVCEVTQCESPPVVQDGSFSPNKDLYEYNDVIDYTCKKDYTVVGSRQLHCSDDGTFKPEPPKCISTAQNCPRPPKGENMDLKGNDILLTSFPDGTTVTFACNTGYKSAGGSPRITCTAGSWSPLGLKCQRKNCFSVEDVQDGQIEYRPGTEFGDKAVLICNIGYMPVGGGELTCGSQGWMGRLPVCEVTQCESPPVVQDGSFSPNKDLYEYNNVIYYTCKKDYTVVGSRQSYCSDDGTFKPEPPKCIKVECEDPEISFGQLSSGARPPYGYLSTVTLQCNAGYTMTGSATVTCELNGQWSPGLPQCIRKSKIKIIICKC
ncbi:complement component receptor 1-like protein isoform X1 [Maylandia zebra]|uniref:complement component receptor 1-like protein isoform X1 n=1 Tax=Maylandia zebra TaxID=106582 RepID=UPI00403CE1C9